MPAAIPAIAAAATAAVSGTTIFGLGIAASSALIGVSSFALNTLQGSLQSKPKSTNLAPFAAKSSNRTVQIRQPITYRRYVYGELRLSGPLIFGASTQSNKFLHLVIRLADHEVEAIDEVWLNDDVIPDDYLDADGNVTTGKYAGRVRIRKHLGGDGQTADDKLVLEVPEWTSAHRGRGVAYIYVRLQFNRKKFPTGTPNISAVVRGKKLFDPRTGSTVYSPNPALMVRDWFTDTKLGLKASTGSVDDDDITSAANTAEEIVTTQNADTDVDSVSAGDDTLTLDGDLLTLQRGDRVQIVTTGTAPGGLATSTDYYVIPWQWGGTPRIKLATSLDNAVAGTAINITGSGTGDHTVRKTGEPRYFAAGSSDAEELRGDALRDIASGMGGAVIHTGGTWSVSAASYQSPSETIDESTARKAITVDPRRTRLERFNTVKGVYVSPLNSWQPSDYPAWQKASYVTADNNEVLETDLDLPYTPRPHTAQRLASIALEKNRREIRVDYPCKLHALQFKPTDTLYVDNTDAGFSSKVFEVGNWRLSVEDTGGKAPVIGVDLGLNETDSAVYSWSSSGESDVAPAPRTNLPNVFDVDAPVGLAVDSIPVETLAGDTTFRVVLSWDEHQNIFVTEGGKFAIQYKKSTDLTWIPATPADGDDTRADVFTGELGTVYDIRIKAISRLLADSDWNTLSGFVVGTAGGVSATQDWGSFSETIGTTQDWGSFSETIGTTQDWGGFTS